MITIMWFLNIKMVVVITILSVLFVCCDHGGAFALNHAGSSRHTNSERWLPLINGRRPPHQAKLSEGAHHEGVEGHVNTRRTTKSVPETNFHPVPASYSTPNVAGHHLTPPNLIDNRQLEGGTYANTGKDEYCLCLCLLGAKLLI